MTPLRELLHGIAMTLLTFADHFERQSKQNRLDREAFRARRLHDEWEAGYHVGYKAGQSKREERRRAEATRGWEPKLRGHVSGRGPVPKSPPPPVSSVMPKPEPDVHGPSCGCLVSAG